MPAPGPRGPINAVDALVRVEAELLDEYKAAFGLDNADALEAEQLPDGVLAQEFLPALAAEHVVFVAGGIGRGAGLSHRRGGAKERRSWRRSRSGSG